jgi:tetratricopeptide (TPR) repeat protein
VLESLYAAAMTLFALEQYEEAMELCGELISQNPDSPQVRSSALLEEAL